jgi:hypothetical protein
MYGRAAGRVNEGNGDISTVIAFNAISLCVPKTLENGYWTLVLRRILVDTCKGD